MKKNILIGLFVVGTFSSLPAQTGCTPDTAYADTTYGVWPDTIKNFPPAYVGTYYETVIDVKIPTDAGAINPGYTGYPIDSAVLTNVTNLPPGLSYVCDNARCKWDGGKQGCGLIFGTPTTVGTYNITLDMTGYTVVFSNPVGVPQTFTGYKIIVYDTVTGIPMRPVTGNSFVLVNTAMSAIDNYFSLIANRSMTVNVTIFGLPGKKVFEKDIDVSSGGNNLGLPKLEPGFYFYSISDGNYSLNGKFTIVN